MTMHTITAMFHTKAEADRAAAALRHDASLSATNVKVLPDEDVQHTDAPEPGFFASLRNFFMPEEDRYGFAEGMRRGDYMVAVDADEEHTHRIMDILEQAGAIDLEAEEERWRREGWQPGQSRTGGSHAAMADAAGMATGGAMMPDVAARDAAGPAGAAVPSAATTTAGPVADRSSAATMAARTGPVPGGAEGSRIEPAAGVSAPASASATASGTAPGAGVAADAPAAAKIAARTETAEERIPLVEERLRVGKRQAIAGRVRIRSYVVETPVTETVHLREEHIQVERRPVDRPLTGSEADPFREREIEATETREVPVVSKEARVREELVLHKSVEERDETIQDKVRHTEVREERDGDTASGVSGTDRDPGTPRQP